MTSILAFLFVIGILIFIHELGHFSIAKLFGVRVEKFSLGFGTKVFSFIRGETEYLISLLPLGGYVKMYGEGMEDNIIVDRITEGSPASKAGFRSGDRITKIDDIDISAYRKWEQLQNHLKSAPSMVRTFALERDGEKLNIKSDIDGIEGITAYTEAEYPRGFSNKTIMERFLIVFAGPFMNFLLPFLFLPIVFMIGISVPAYLEKEPVVGHISEESHAEAAGFMIGDRIVSIDGKQTNTWRDVNVTLQTNPDRIVEVEVQRNGHLKELMLKAEASPEGVVDVGLSEPFEAVVGNTIEGSPASRAGLERGDRILSINDIKINDWQHMTSVIRENTGNELSLLIERKDEQFTTTLTPEVNPQTGEGAIGITLYTEEIIKKYGFFESIVNGVVEAAKMVYEVTVLLLGFLFKLITGQIGLGTAGKSIAGPVFIAKISGAAAETGLAQLLQFTSFISINLAVINLLPIPVLDGGHIMYLTLESIKRKPLDRRTIAIFQRLGFALLIFIMIFAIYNDIARLVGIY